MTLKDLHNKWQTNSLAYRQHEIGSGIHDLTVQRFDNVQVVGNHLVLHYNNKEYKLEITKDKTEFVKKIISDNYYDNSLIFKRKEVSLQELLNLETIDFDQQTKIKTEIDELVGEMYQLRTKLVSISNK